MEVPIDYGDSFELVVIQCVVSGQSHIIEKAESHCATVFGGVPGRPYKGKPFLTEPSITPSTRHKRPPTADTAASRSGNRSKCLDLEKGTLTSCSTHYPVHISRIMVGAEFIQGRFPGLYIAC